MTEKRWIIEDDEPLQIIDSKGEYVSILFLVLFLKVKILCIGKLKQNKTNSNVFSVVEKRTGSYIIVWTF